MFKLKRSKAKAAARAQRAGVFHVDYSIFISSFARACSTNPLIVQYCSPPHPSSMVGKSLYLLPGYNAGFCIDQSGELSVLFSGSKGQGGNLVRAAIKLGASHLDCFDGYLLLLYKSHGFKVVKREANWFEGGSDVVYMSLGDK